MRKFIFSILLASAATSASALPPTSDSESDRPKAERQEAREQRQAAREESRQQRSDGASDVGRARQQEQQPQQPQAEVRRQQWQGGNFGAGQRDEARQQQWQGRRLDERNNVQTQIQTPQAPEQQRSNRTGGRDGSRWTDNRDGRSGSWSGGDLRQGDRATPNVMRDRNSTIVNDQQQQQTRSGTWSGRTWNHNANNNTRWAGNWNRDWRNDRRYDWRRYRDSHRSIFHIGIYYDPFGYNSYRPFNIGYRLYPSYYGQQYWIDPGLYQLPYPPPGTVWVRYWDDALLVDMYSGEVVDVIRNFFW
jgi:Ni/Co efflux regulator RcnB